uniref:Uncharacterized protein n=1 Tax=Salarias fasciatus TaxID=181472 RepID=A0A672G4E6_SALFA
MIKLQNKTQQGQEEQDQSRRCFESYLQRKQREESMRAAVTVPTDGLSWQFPHFTQAMLCLLSILKIRNIVFIEKLQYCMSLLLLFYLWQYHPAGQPGHRACFSL